MAEIQTTIESDLGMHLAIWSLYLAIHDFAFLKHSFQCKSRVTKESTYLLIFVIRENEILISVNRDSETLCDPLSGLTGLKGGFNSTFIPV